MVYAVYKNDKRVSKFYENELAAIIDAFEQKLVVNCGRYGKCFVDGVIVKAADRGLFNQDALDYFQQYGAGA